MKHAIIENGNPVFYTERFFTDANGIQYPLRAMDQASKLAIGVYEVQTDYTIPEGFRQIGKKLEFDGTTVTEVYNLEEIPPLTNEELKALVKKERDRRLQADFEFMGKMYQRDTESLARITGAATLAGFAMGAGAQAGDLRWANPDRDFGWIASDDTVTPMDAPTAFAFGQAAAEVETSIVFAAKALREMNPIPTDFTNDIYWP